MEKAYDLSCGGREVVNGACEQEVGNTVNKAEATWTSEIGRAILGADWEDPDFDPNQPFTTFGFWKSLHRDRPPMTPRFLA